jgi:hypothetical protein
MIGDVNGKLVAVAAAMDVGVEVQAVGRETKCRATLADFRVSGALKSPSIQSLHWKRLRRMLWASVSQVVEHKVRHGEAARKRSWRQFVRIRSLISRE